MEHWIGLDLGRQADASAFVVLEPVVEIPAQPTPEELERSNRRRMPVREVHFHVRAIARSSPGTPYPTTVRKLEELSRHYRPTWTHFDATGVGKAVGDMITTSFREGRILGRRPVGLVITGGHTSSGHSISKVDLVSNVTRALTERRLHVDPDLPGAHKLAQELRDFVVTPGRSSDTYGAATESRHDDLVVALAMALVPNRKYRFGTEPGGATELRVPSTGHHLMEAP